MLFQIKNTEAFIIASFHLCPEGTKLPKLLADTVSSAEDCFFEHDFANFREPIFCRYAPNDSMENYISPELFKKALKFWQEIGATNPLSPLKPWYAGISMAMCLLVRSGNKPEAGIDKQLLQIAKQTSKRTFFLESIDDGLRPLDTAPLSEQIAGLEYFLSNTNRAVETFNLLYRAWCDSAINTFSRELEERIKLCPMTFRGLLHDRNKNWIPKILHAVECKRRTVFVVGTYHLAGDHSLQKFLAVAQPSLNLVQIA